MKNRQVIILFVLFTLPPCSAFSQPLNLKSPPADVSLFMEGTITTYLNERDMALSPDGKEIYFTVSTPQSTFQTIVFIQQDAKGKWSKPKVAPFAGKFSDLEPAFDTGGTRLFFASNRPIHGTEKKDFDIWVVERKNKEWGEPNNLGQAVNTSADEFYPSSVKTGNLFFTAEYDDGVGREDIYESKWAGDHFEKAIPLDTGVNSKFYEFNAFVDPDEQFILFTSYGRKDDTGRGDLYISRKGTNGSWQPAVNIKLVNSDRLDYCPYVSPDKKIFFFTSERAAMPNSFEKPTSYELMQGIFHSVLNGTGNVYWVSFDKLWETTK